MNNLSLQISQNSADHLPDLLAQDPINYVGVVKKTALFLKEYPWRYVLQHMYKYNQSPILIHKPYPNLLW